MARQSKRFLALLEKVQGVTPLAVPEAVQRLRGLEGSLPKTIKPCRFDQTVEVSLRLGVDPKQADQLVRGSVVLPHGTGKRVRVLGPRKLMPSPRAGTVTDDVASAVKEYKAGKVEFRCDAGGNVHAPVGKLSFSAQQLTDNVQAFLNYVRSVRPSAAKGTYIRSAAVSATMTPSIPLSA